MFENLFQRKMPLHPPSQSTKGLPGGDGSSKRDEGRGR